MKYLDFKNQLSKYICFSLSDIRTVDPAFRRRQLYEWQDQGYIRKVRRGFYMFSDVPLSDAVLYAVSNKIYPHSYISLESALSFYGLIPEGVFTVTAVSTKNTASFSTEMGTFTYRHITPTLFGGYTVVGDESRARFKIATLEKTVLDYVYFHPEIVQSEDFTAWRFASTDFTHQADLEKLRTLAAAVHRPGLEERIETFIHLVQNNSYA